MAVHAGEPEGVLAPPLALGSVYTFDGLEPLEAAARGKDPHRFYRRYGHANARQLEACMARLEGTEDALATSAGLSALFSALVAALSRGDHLVAQEDLYGGTYALLERELPARGIEVTLVAGTPGAIRRALRPNTRAVLVESISNPFVRVADLRGIARVAATAGATLLVDSTFATPALIRPVEHGAHVVLHSATKFLGGHADAVAGIVCGPADLVRRARSFAIATGGTVSPLDAWLVLRGIRTLPLRIDRASANARALVRVLRRHRAVRRVHYGGIGPMLAFELPDRAAAKRFLRAVRLVRLAPSLGDVGTTLAHPAACSINYHTPEVRARLGIHDGVIRVSTGIEDPRDLVADFRRALEGIR